MRQDGCSSASDGKHEVSAALWLNVLYSSANVQRAQLVHASCVARAPRHSSRSRPHTLSPAPCWYLRPRVTTPCQPVSATSLPPRSLPANLQAMQPEPLEAGRRVVLARHHPAAAQARSALIPRRRRRGAGRARRHSNVKDPWAEEPSRLASTHAEGAISYMSLSVT